MKLCKEVQNRQRHYLEQLATQLDDRIRYLTATINKALKGHQRWLASLFDWVEILERHLASSTQVLAPSSRHRVHPLDHTLYPSGPPRIPQEHLVTSLLRDLLRPWLMTFVR